MFEMPVNSQNRENQKKNFDKGPDRSDSTERLISDLKIKTKTPRGVIA